MLKDLFDKKLTVYHEVEDTTILKMGGAALGVVLFSVLVGVATRKLTS